MPQSSPLASGVEFSLTKGPTIRMAHCDRIDSSDGLSPWADANETGYATFPRSRVPWNARGHAKTWMRLHETEAWFFFQSAVVSAVPPLSFLFPVDPLRRRTPGQSSATSPRFHIQSSNLAAYIRQDQSCIFSAQSRRAVSRRGISNDACL